MKHISSQYNNVCRNDGIINVHIAPFYSMYNHHHNYWGDWYHAYMLSKEKKDSWGDSYRNFKNLPDGVWFINSTQFLNIKSLKTLSVGKNFFVNGDYDQSKKIVKRNK